MPIRRAALVPLLALAIGCGERTPTIPADASATVDASTIDAADPCPGLDRDTCANTDGCVIQTCDSCSCEPTFQACRAATSTAPMDCPVLDCPTPLCCGGAAECSPGEQCHAPEAPAGCGICRFEPEPCADDAACQTAGPGFICEPLTCACTGSDRTCVPGCTAADCDDGTACSATSGRCEPRACDAATPCPADFDCTSGSCARRGCTTDTTCDGFCVEGSCYAGRGVCAGLPG